MITRSLVAHRLDQVFQRPDRRCGTPGAATRTTRYRDADGEFRRRSARSQLDALPRPTGSPPIRARDVRSVASARPKCPGSVNRAWATPVDINDIKTAPGGQST